MPEVFIVILTNFADFNYAKEAIGFGAYDYLIKSEIRPKEIKEILFRIDKKIKGNELQIKPPLNNKNEVKKRYSKTIEKALRYIEENYKNHISLIDVARRIQNFTQLQK